MEQGTDAKIYGRTQLVQDVIVAGLSGVTDSALVTDAHLAAITTLNLSGQGMTALRADDFASLTHLQELRLSGNALTTLPTGVFSGLTVDIRYCQVDGKLVDRPPRYWARASREPAILGIRNGRQPQLDNTCRKVA